MICLFFAIKKSGLPIKRVRTLYFIEFLIERTVITFYFFYHSIDESYLPKSFPLFLEPSSIQR